MVRLKDIAEVRTNFPEADFWLIRRGSLERLGEVSRGFDPEAIGIQVVREDLILPDFLYYYMTKVWMDGYWCGLGIRTTRLCNITTRDVKDLVLPWEYPVEEVEEEEIPWQVDGRMLGSIIEYEGF